MAYSAKNFESALAAETPVIINPEDAATVAGFSRAVAASKHRNRLGVAGVAAVAGVYQERDQTPLLPEQQETERFPHDVLNGLFGQTVTAVQQATQAPIAMCTSSVLATIAMAVQPLRNVDLPGAGIKPISLFFLSIAGSGERKTSADKLVGPALEARKSELMEEYKAAFPSYKKAQEAYENAKTEALKSSKGYQAKKNALEALGPEPEAPINPALTANDITFEALVKTMYGGQPAFGLFSDEGGQFFGGHGMKDDAKIATIAGLSKLWDGSPVERIRATDNEFSILQNRRLSLHMMIQPTLCAKTMKDKEARGQGMFARMLICYPETTVGTRMFRETDEQTKKDLEDFNQHILGILRQPLPLIEGTKNELKPPALALDEEARKVWIAFYNTVEQEQRPGGTLENVRDWASKACEHAGRIAAVLTLFEDPDAVVIPAERMADAIQLTKYYLSEFQRIVSTALSLDEATDEAQSLLTWLRDKWPHSHVSPSDIGQYGPRPVRPGDIARRAIGKLVANGWLVPEQGLVEIGGKRRNEAYRIKREED